jgi:hypothetical protein
VIEGLTVDEQEQHDPHVLRPDHHPTPFLADEIRAASRAGRMVRQLVEVAGESQITRVQQWLDVDDEGATRAISTLDIDGNTIDERRAHSTWLELQRHASMPVATTTIDEVTIDSPMGPLDCLRYTSIDGDTVETFWFARSIPGMPVYTERRLRGELVERVTMLSNQVEPLPGEADARRPNP